MEAITNPTRAFGAVAVWIAVAEGFDTTNSLFEVLAAWGKAMIASFISMHV